MADKFPVDGEEIPLYSNPGITKCCNETCLDRLRLLIGGVGFDYLRDKGILEYSTMSTTGGFLCNFLNFAEANGIFNGLSVLEITEIIDRIMDNGIVISCQSDILVIASVETYLKYAEAVGLTQDAAVPL